jgi:hypothetical protein
VAAYYFIGALNFNLQALDEHWMASQPTKILSQESNEAKLGKN